MDVAWVIGAALFGLIAGAALRGRSMQKPLPNTQELSAASDLSLLLTTLRRELANYMVRRDPDRFLRLYKQAHADASEICKADKTSRKAKLAGICDKYSFIHDFDLLATREHVLYEDAMSGSSIEDIEAHYLDIVNFHALRLAPNEEWNTATSNRNLEHLEKYARRIKDTKFKQRLIDANRIFNAGREDYEYSADSLILFENHAINVRHVYHIAEKRYGFHFKDTNEYGLYGVFYDDGRDKTYFSYFRSDQNFETEKYLDTLVDFDGPIY
jgi:hypothetical protein